MTALAPDSLIAAIRDRLVGPPARGDAALAAQDQTPPLPDDVLAWLAELVLLYGLPLEYVVANPALLPAESLRFFYLDSNWQRRLIDGALSIGLSSSLDSLSLLVTYEDTVLQTLNGTTGVRAQLRGKTKRIEATGTPGIITGFLLRSAVVSGWPGMEVSAYADPGQTALPLLRLDRVTSDIMLGLFNGLPSEVNFLEPPEGLHFGVIPSSSQSTVFLRGLGYGGFAPGIQLQPTASATLVTRSSAAGMLDIAASVTALQTALQAKGAWSSGDPFTSAEFAIQMTRGAGLQIFQWPKS
jgi:hypothetical protein